MSRTEACLSFSPPNVPSNIPLWKQVKYPEEGEEKKKKLSVICTMEQNSETGVQRRSL